MHDSHGFSLAATREKELRGLSKKSQNHLVRSANLWRFKEMKEKEASAKHEKGDGT